MDNSVVILIPARLNSSRFPRKILYPVNGKPMILHILEAAKNLGICECYVACCCEETKQLIESNGGKAILTDPELPSGTDRVFAAISSLPQRPSFVINLQGDTIVFGPSIIPAIIKVLKENEDVDMTTPVVLCDNESDEANNHNIVKVVFNGMDTGTPGKALYFSRNLIPHGSNTFYSHIGIYAYRLPAIERFVSLKPSYLEVTERLEQLRAMQNGMNIWAVPVKENAISIDVMDDLKAVL
ncbi:MAG: 3-deoxy-manno-octulosonate cytidylyltransferase [Holosporales bacterium]|jgi:3-deoxy-manno-octulosonate cytidylyltransferase (CMP-KDO synthetase)|nr:3-deoxy-manno-octulosonate cytidylyltransferase [Holosporales bacterium]